MAVVGRGLLGRPRLVVVAVAGGAALVLLLVAGVVAVATPVPFVDGYVRHRVAAAVGAELACPGSGRPPAEVSVGGDRLLQQVIAKRLTRIQVRLPDTAFGEVPHARLDADLRGVTRSGSGPTTVQSIEVAGVIGFADLPGGAADPRPAFGRTDDGRLTVTTVAAPGDGGAIEATVYLALTLDGDSVTATPRSLRIFGKDVPAVQAADWTGSARTLTLPPLPDGVSYRSVAVQQDGLHVTIAGAATRPLSGLPTDVGGHAVSYRTQGGRLSISLTAQVPILGAVPITVVTRPTLRGRTMTLVPQSVAMLGNTFTPQDLAAIAVLSQIPTGALTHTLPELPTGVRYTGVTVGPAGFSVGVAGVAVRGFAELARQQAPDGSTTFGAADGMLTATSTGTGTSTGTTGSTGSTASGGSAAGPVLVMTARPQITDGALELRPDTIRLFGVDFPAETVLAQTHATNLVYPLAALPSGMTYTGVEVLDQGLRITAAGSRVVLPTELPVVPAC